MVKLMSTFLIPVILISVCFVLIAPVLSADVSTQKQTGYTEENASQSAKTEKKRVNVSCEFKLLSNYFFDYYKYFPELVWEYPAHEWFRLEGKYNCEETMSFIRDQQKKLYELNITQTTPENGINKGIFIAYGNYIKPPYKLVVDVDKPSLLINGVPLAPVVDFRGSLPETELDKIDNRLKDSVNKYYASLEEIKELEKVRMRMFLNYLVKKYGKKKGLAKFESYLKSLVDSDLGISDYWIYDKENLLFDIYTETDEWSVPKKYFYSEDDLKQEIKVNPCVILSGEDYKKCEAERIKSEKIDAYKEYKTQIINALNQDKVVFHSYLGLTELRVISKNKFRKICSILSSDLTYLTKVVNLADFFPGNYKIYVFEVIDNLTKTDLKDLNKCLSEGE